MALQGYLLAALVLTRPLLERVATLSYLVENPAQAELWKQGWPHRRRPSLRTRMKAMGLTPAHNSPTSVPGAPNADDINAMIDRYNGLVHSDPTAAYSTAVLLPDGRPGYAAGKDLSSPTRANRICGETLVSRGFPCCSLAASNCSQRQKAAPRSLRQKYEIRANCRSDICESIRREEGGYALRQAGASLTALDANYRRHGRWWSAAQAGGMSRSGAATGSRAGCCTSVRHIRDLDA